MTPDIIFEDNHLIVVNKPAGLLTQPTDLSQESLETYYKEWLKEKYNKPGNVYLHAVHRLDRPVSGIVLFAKTSKSLSRLQEEMRAHKIEKRYLALIEGAINPPQGKLVHYLKHEDHCATCFEQNVPDSKRAELQYKAIDKNLLEVTLLTGRYHQIRAQLAFVGHPIAGDKKYGSTRAYLDGAVALHHHYMKCTHPTTKALLNFEAKPSSEFMQLAEQFS